MKFLILLGVLFLSSCANIAEAEQIGQMPPETAPLIESVEVLGLQQEVNLRRLGLIIERPSAVGSRLGAYSGIYLGAELGGISIREFQNSLDVDHAIVAKSFYINGGYPLMFVLEAIANNAAPMLNFYGEYNAESIEKIAKDAGIFNVPLFVSFNSSDSPNLQEINRFFGEYAPNVRLVLNIEPALLNFAGEIYGILDYIDWLNLVFVQHLDYYGNFDDISEKIAKYHLMFQRYLPLMVSVSVSNHNLNNNTHFAYEASRKILHIYDLIASYPRINAIIYMNKADNNNRQNSLLTNSMLTMEAYRNALNSPHILGSVSNSKNDTIFLKSIFNAVEIEGSFFIPKYGLFYSAGLNPELFEHLNSIKLCNIGSFYEMSKLYRDLGMDFFVMDSINSLILKVGRSTP